MNNKPQTSFKTGPRAYPHVACRLTVDGKEALLIMATRLLIKEQDGSISTQIIQLAPSVSWPRQPSSTEIADMMNPDNLAAPLLPGYTDHMETRMLATAYMGYMKRLAQYLKKNPTKRPPYSTEWLNEYRKYTLKYWDLDNVIDVLNKSIRKFFDSKILSMIEGYSVYQMEMGLVRFLPIYNAFALASESTRARIKDMLQNLRWQTLPSGTLLKAILSIYEGMLPYAFHHMWDHRENILECLVNKPEIVAQKLCIPREVWQWFGGYPEDRLPWFHSKNIHHIALAAPPTTRTKGTELGLALPYHEISGTIGTELSRGCLNSIHNGEDVALMRDIYAHASRPVPSRTSSASNVRFMLIALASHMRVTADQPDIPKTTPWWRSFVPILAGMVPAIEAMVERFLTIPGQSSFTNSWAIMLAIGAYQGQQDREAIAQACVDNRIDLAALILGAPEEHRNLALNTVLEDASPITRRYGYPLPVATLFRHLTEPKKHFFSRPPADKLLNLIPPRLGQWHPARIDMTGQDFIALKRRTLQRLEPLATASLDHNHDRIQLPGFLGYHAPEILFFLEDHRNREERQEELTYWDSISLLDFPPDIVEQTDFSEIYRNYSGQRIDIPHDPHTIGRIMDEELANPLFPDTSQDTVAFLDIHQLMRVSEGTIENLLEWALYLPTTESLEHHQRLQASAAHLFSSVQRAIDSRNLIMPTLAWAPRLEFPLATPEQPYLIGFHNNEKPLNRLKGRDLIRGEPRFLNFGLEKQIIAGLTGSPETDFTLIVDQSYTGFTRISYAIPPQQMLSSWTRKVLDAASHQKTSYVLLMTAWMIVNTTYALMLIMIKIRTAMKTYKKSNLNHTMPFTKEIMNGPREWRMPVLALGQGNNRSTADLARLFTSNWSLDLMVMNQVLEFSDMHGLDDMTAMTNRIAKLIQQLSALYGQNEHEK